MLLARQGQHRFRGERRSEGHEKRQSEPEAARRVRCCCRRPWIWYIGIHLNAAMWICEGTATSAASPTKLFRQGFITSSANPFAVMFFAALFPQFIDPAAPTLPQLAILGGTYLLVDCVILLAWGSLAAVAAARLRMRALGFINRICGTLMLGAAFLLASKDLELRQSR